MGTRTGHRGEFWQCNVCGAQNHDLDGECQFCDCEGRECKRDNCADPLHFAHLRSCEWGNCMVERNLEAMCQAASGSWYCPEHAAKGGA